MPPKRPPGPGLLLLLCTVGAAVAAWSAVAFDQGVRMIAGEAAGLRATGLVVGAGPAHTLEVAWSPWPALAPPAVAIVVLSGSLLLVPVAAGMHAFTGLLRAPGWLRGLLLQLVLVALAWWPAALIGGLTGASGGPVGELYQRLGDPKAGRWAAAGLGIVILALAAGPASRRAVAVGAAWMRADSPGFRRRLVRTLGGYPVAGATVALMIFEGWAGPAAALLFGLSWLGALHIRTE